jgi:hypothetical protein
LSNEARDQLLHVLQRDLIGPRNGPEETISDRPSDRYLTGALYPAPTDDDAKPRDEHDADPQDAESSGPGEAVDLGSTHRPVAMGVSLLVEGATPTLEIVGSAGRYERDPHTGDWRRSEIRIHHTHRLTDEFTQFAIQSGLQCTVRPVSAPGGRLVSVVISNTARPAPGRDATDAATFFQVGFSVRVRNGRVLPRLPRTLAGDSDADTNRLIYRHVVEFASGHACSATWDDEDGEIVVSTSWLPQQLTPGISADGHALFGDLSAKRYGNRETAFLAERYAGAESGTLSGLLSTVPDAYAEWLTQEEQRALQLARSAQISPPNHAQFLLHLKAARTLVERMRRGIAIVCGDAVARDAFQLAQRAMIQQARWRKRDPALVFTWRPFQVAFQLLAIVGLAEPHREDGEASDDRLLMDLLWFPTGGGKTEAYLALVAFTLLLRRLRSTLNPDHGAGVGAFMRYTLRLLSAQQFERAARVVIACDRLRLEALRKGDRRLGSVPFSIGLWVGNDVTPNRRSDCTKPEEIRKAKQLAACPVCGSRSALAIELKRAPDRVVMSCQDSGCPVHAQELPVWTVDDDIYERKPSLLIATVDKFAQIVRVPQIRDLLRVDDNPPDLVIQDELHLIAGPLGSMVGLYEVAVERLCSRNGIPPKIIGSTATIRRADRQVHDLYDRPVQQFPPPVLDAGDSCFAVTDPSRPGRLYVGLSSAGRSPKFLLQAVSAVLLQGAEELPAAVEARDPYWTLLLYFNSLRELGGALVMLLDDVGDSMKILAELSGRALRRFDDEPMEMTSRTGSADLPDQLKTLEERWPAQRYGPVLATNMISVGVDVDRLGLMIVNGQPKSMAEYIQATSRVGREHTPGLIVTCYNAGRARDRSHFESFRTWHQALYREVEASSATPFAPRARDRALHAPLVAMVRHTIAGMANDPPCIKSEHTAAIDKLISRVVARAASVDADERTAVENELRSFAQTWARWAGLEVYWNDRKRQSLLISAERAADLAARNGSYAAAARPTPGSMRNVEPSSVMVLREGLAAHRGGGAT